MAWWGSRDGASGSVHDSIKMWTFNAANLKVAIRLPITLQFRAEVAWVQVGSGCR